MPADQPRTRTVGCKMTDNEYERLAAVAEGDGMTLGEWVAGGTSSETILVFRVAAPSRLFEGAGGLVPSLESAQHHPQLCLLFFHPRLGSD